MSQSQKPPKKPPRHAIVPGTKFTVDWHCKTLPEYIHSFLTHAHSDHTSGLGSFKAPRMLHCSEITKNLILLTFPKLAPVVQSHPYMEPFTIDNVKVTLIPANHTPGSTMFLFETESKKKILHTGDFRGESQVIQDIAKFSPIDTIYMDCTYSIANVIIPKRSEVIRFVVDRVRDALKSDSLVLLGTYTTGKEDLVYSVASELSVKVYAPEKRLDTLKALANSGWKSGVFFTEDSKSKVHLVSINQTGMNEAKQYANEHGYESVVVFQISGWNGKPNWKSPKSYNGVVSYGVPYSDHSSKEELIDFVRTTRPVSIVPITHSKPNDLEKINQVFLPYLRKHMNSGCIDFYGTPSQSQNMKLLSTSEDE